MSRQEGGLKRGSLTVLAPVSRAASSSMRSLGLGLVTALAALDGCAVPTRYLADLKQEEGSAAAPITVRIGPFRYSTDRMHPVGPGWFVVEPLPVVLVNQTDLPVLVDWDRSALVSPAGETLRIVHSGVSYPDAKSGNYQTYQKTSLIAPRAKLSEKLVPAEWIYAMGGEWCVLERSNANERFILSITFDIDGKSTTIGTPFVIGEGRLVVPGDAQH